MTELTDLQRHSLKQTTYGQAALNVIEELNSRYQAAEGYVASLTAQRDEAVRLAMSRMSYETYVKMEVEAEKARSLLGRAWRMLHNIDRPKTALERSIYDFLHPKPRDTSKDTKQVWFDPDRGYIFRDTELAPEEKK